MKIIIVFLLFAGAIRADEEPNLTNRNQKPDLAEQCAEYIAQQSESKRSGDRRHNRLSDDPEQQLERASCMYSALVIQLHTIAQKINPESSASQLQQFELACRIIVQALLHSYTNGNKEALGQADTCTHVVAHIKLLQDPFWLNVLRETEAKKRDIAPSAYSIEEFDAHLQVDESKKDRLIKQLLTQLEAKQEHAHAHAHPISDPAADELYNELAPYKKNNEQILSVIAEILAKPQSTRVKLTPKAIELFNGAVTSEISANLEFLRLKDKYAYPNLEQAFGAVALIYLQAHDNGHPRGLAEAEQIMNGGIMSAIVNWKKKYNVREPYAFYASIWEEINKRKHPHPDAHSSAASSSTSSS